MEINLQQFLLQLVNFVVLFVILSKFVYKPVLKILDERANKINDGLKAAEKSLHEQIKIEETKQKELIKAQRQATDILEEAEHKAEKLSKELIEQARVEARKAVADEEKLLLSRLEKEEKRVKSEVANLVTQTTESLLRNSLSATAQKEIIKNQIKDLKQLKG